MRRACRRSARILASVLLPTRSGPSMTMKRGACGPRVGTGARLAEVDSLGDMIQVTVNARDYSRAAKRGGHLQMGLLRAEWAAEHEQQKAAWLAGPEMASK